jgi:hypothetical protein
VDWGTYVGQNIAQVGGNWGGDDREVRDSSAGNGSEESEVLELHLDGIAKLSDVKREIKEEMGKLERAND